MQTFNLAVFDCNVLHIAVLENRYTVLPGALRQRSRNVTGIRLPVGEDLPQYLPWPRIPDPPSGDALSARYLGADGLPAILLGEPLFISSASRDTPPPQPCDESTQCFPVVDAPFAGGTLAINNHQPEAFSDLDVEILSRIAGLLDKPFARFLELIDQRRTERARRDEVELQEALDDLRRIAAQITPGTRVIVKPL